MGYKLTLQRNSDNHVLSHPAQAIDAANLALAGRVIIDDISWFVPHYTPSISNHTLMLEHVVSKALIELSYIKRSSYMEDVTTENNDNNDIRHHPDYSSAQTIKVRFDFRPAVPAATNLIGYALLLTNKLVSVSSDGQRQFDLV